MVNPVLVIITVILAVAIIIGCIYVLVYFQHPEDKNLAWFPKVIVIAGLALSCFAVLMLPLDVGNGTTGGFPMAALWQAIFIVMTVMAIAVIPFAMFYYEGDEYDDSGEAPSQLAYALKGTFITVLVFFVVTVVLWLFIGIAQIPVVQLEATFVTTVNRTVPASSLTNLTATQFEYFSPKYNNTDNFTDIPYNLGSGIYSGSCVPIVNLTMNYTVNGTVITNSSLVNGTCFYYNPDVIPSDKDLPYFINRNPTTAQFRVTFTLYIITVVVFFGWLLLIIFGGIGMVAFPWDCVQSWRRRPIRIPLSRFTERKAEIGQQATLLIQKGKAIQEKQRKGRERKRDRKNYNKFRQAVFMLEDEYERLQLSYKRQGGKIILYFLTFILGLISAGLTIIWLLHIILYMFTQPYPINPFLNTMFVQLNNAWPLLGTIAYGVFAFYLLICCIKGNFKFGMRLFFLFPIHPMRVGGTLMNAFLFNTGLIVVCTFSVIQFCSNAFSEYDSNTTINTLFTLAVQNMMGIKYIFIGYVYVLFIMVFLTAIYFVVKPSDRPAINDIVV